MTIVKTDRVISLYDKWPIWRGFASTFSRADALAKFHLQGATYEDDSWTDVNTRPLAIYIGGTGVTGTYDIDHPIITGLIAQGFRVLMCTWLGQGTSSSDWRLGNIGLNSWRQLTLFNYRLAFLCASALQWAEGTLYKGLTPPSMIGMGSSLGAGAWINWSIMKNSPQFAGQGSYIKGLLLNGFTAGGDTKRYAFLEGSYEVGQLLQLVKHRTCLMFATNDKYSYPDDVRRWMRWLPTDSPITVVSPGEMDGGHNWMSNTTDYWPVWASAVLSDTTLYLPDGTAAVPGPLPE